MLHVAEIGQPGNKNHRWVADRQEYPLTRGIRHAPAWPAGQRDLPSPMRGEIDHLELGSASVITDACGHREMRPGDDRDTVGSRSGFEPRILFERRRIQPYQFRRA